MPVPNFVFSTADPGRGRPFTRIQGPVVVGGPRDSTPSGPLSIASGVIVVQSTASLTNQVVTTSATGAARNSHIYIPVTTGIFQGVAAPAYAGAGAPLLWNDNTRRLEIWSSGAAEWLTMSSSGTFSSS